MNNEKEFLKKMENLSVPQLNPQHQHRVKMTILSAQKSASIGIWLIILPYVFYLWLFITSRLDLNFPQGWIWNYTLATFTTPWVAVLNYVWLLALPGICLIANLLAITHVQHQKASPANSKISELVVTFKLRWFNIILILLSLVLLAVPLFFFV
jgi:hypothetical protein